MYSNRQIGSAQPVKRVSYPDSNDVLNRQFQMQYNDPGFNIKSANINQRKKNRRNINIMKMNVNQTIQQVDGGGVASAKQVSKSVNQSRNKYRMSTTCQTSLYDPGNNDEANLMNTLNKKGSYLDTSVAHNSQTQTMTIQDSNLGVNKAGKITILQKTPGGPPNQKQEILSKQFSMNTTNFGSAGLAQERSSQAGGSPAGTNQNYIKTNLITQQSSLYNAAKVGTALQNNSFYKHARVKSGIERFSGQPMPMTHGRFNKNASMYMASGMLSGALSGNIESLQQQPQPTGGLTSAQHNQNKEGEDIFSNQPYYRPKTSGKPNAGKKINFNAGQPPGYLSKGQIRQFGHNQLGQSDLLYGPASKISSDFKLNNDETYNNLDQVHKIGQYLQYQKSQPIIGKKVGRGRQQNRFRNIDSFATNQLIHSSGPHLASSSHGRGSSQSPNRVEAANKLVQYPSHLNMVPEAESATAANPLHNYDYDIKNTDMFESQNAELFATGGSAAVTKDVLSQRTRLNRQSGQFMSRGSGIDKGSHERSGNDRYQGKNFSNLNLKTFDHIRLQEEIDIISGQKIDPALRYLKDFVLQNHDQSRRHHSNVATRKLSQPRNQHIETEEVKSHKKQLELYNNRVLIDRQGTKQLEKNKNARNAGAASQSPDQDIVSGDGGLTRDYNPTSSNYGRLVNSQGISASQSIRQQRIYNYMQQVEAIRSNQPNKLNISINMRNSYQKPTRGNKGDDSYSAGAIRSEQTSAKQSPDGKQTVTFENLEHFKQVMKEQTIGSHFASQHASSIDGKYSTKYLNEGNEQQSYKIINMIVEKFVKDEDASHKLSHIRRFGAFEDPKGNQIHDGKDPNRIQLGSALSKASQQSDRETASKIQNAVRKKMDANLQRFSELTPRTNQDNTLEYNNINQVLEELDQQLAERMSKLSKNQQKDCAQKLQNSVRLWLKESKLQRFVRDVIKIVKLSKICNMHQRRLRARDFFRTMQAVIQDPNAQDLQLLRQSRTQNPSAGRNSVTMYKNTDAKFSATQKLSSKQLAVKVTDKNKSIKKGTARAPSRKKSTKSPSSPAGLQTDQERYAASRKPQTRRSLSPPMKGDDDNTFFSPKSIPLNTISINIGRNGEKQGQFVGGPPNDSISNAGHFRPKKDSVAIERNLQNVGVYRQMKVMKERVKILRGELIKPPDEHEARNKKVDKKVEKGSKLRGSSNINNRADHRGRQLSTQSSFSHSHSDHIFERSCCKLKKIHDHTKPEWSLGYEWVKQDFKVPGLTKESAPGENEALSQEQEVSMRKIKELRRKQFFNFLVDFFDKFEAGEMKYKLGKNVKFTAEEKQKWLKKYFMKYFMENVEQPYETKTITLDRSAADQKRQCSCTKGQYDEKTGDLIPAYALKKNQAKKKQTIQVRLPPEFTTKEMRDAQHGKSAGMNTKMDKKVLNKDLDDILEKKMKKATRKREDHSPIPTLNNTTIKPTSNARGSLRTSENGSSPVPGQGNSPSKLNTIQEAKFEVSRSSIGKISPMKMLNTPVKLGNLNAAAGEIERRSSLVKSLLKNSVQARLQNQILDMFQNLKNQAKQDAKEFDFKEEFPMYVQMLHLYSDCKFYRSESADILNSERIKPQINFNENMLTTVNTSFQGVNFSQTLNHDLNTGDFTLNTTVEPTMCLMSTQRGERRAGDDCARCQRNNIQQNQRQVSLQEMNNTQSVGKPNNLTISYIESEKVLNNFEHDKTQNNKSKAHELLKFAEKYNASNQYSSVNNTVRHLEHGNYKMFGMSKNQFGKHNKFITKRNDLSGVVSAGHRRQATQNIPAAVKMITELSPRSAHGLSIGSQKYQCSFKKPTLLQQLGLSGYMDSTRYDSQY